MEVEAQPRNAGFDLRVNGKKVDVKSAIETSYPGSDGYPIRGCVFTNVKQKPTSSFYVFACMSKDRKTIEDTYVIPSHKMKQRTFTLTRRARETYAPYKNNYSALEKRAATGREARFKFVGRILGANIGYRAYPKIKQEISGDKGAEYREEGGSVLGAALGFMLGGHLAGEYARRTEDDKK
jgi:hypothetical protein